MLPRIPTKATRNDRTQSFTSQSYKNEKELLKVKIFKLWPIVSLSVLKKSLLTNKSSFISIKNWNSHCLLVSFNCDMLQGHLKKKNIFKDVSIAKK